MRTHGRMALHGLVAWLIALGWAIGADQRAQDVRPVQVIEFARPSGDEKVPVVSSVALGPQGRVLVTAGDDHLARLWDARQGRMLRKLAGHDDWVRCVAFSFDGQYVATAGDDGKIRLWATAAESSHRTLDDSGAGVYALAFSGDGRLLAAAGFDENVRLYDGRTGAEGRARIWNVADGKVRHELAGHRLRVNALAFSPDGSQLAAGGDERSVLLWDTSTGKTAAKLPARPGKILCLAFCGPRQLAVGGSDNTVRVWNLAGGTEAARLVGHTGSVTTLAWDPDASTLISGSFDTTVRMWRWNVAGTALNRRGNAQ
jgi:WD40 repeat protein